jgi:hypothetical protein
MPRCFTFLLLALSPAVAAAQVIPCSDGPCLGPRREGTHFIAEIAGGGALYGRGGGIVVGGLFGAGGQLRRLPLPVYVVTEVAYNTTTDAGRGPTLPEFRDERTHRDLALGLRIYVPVFGPLRLFAEVLGGASYVSASLDRADLAPVSSAGWVKLALVGAGVQVRLFHHFSLGARTRIVLTDDDLGGLRAITGAARAVRVSLLGGMTWHF